MSNKPSGWWTYQEIMDLFYFKRKGLSYSEIGEKLDRSKNECLGKHFRIRKGVPMFCFHKPPRPPRTNKAPPLTYEPWKKTSNVDFGFNKKIKCPDAYMLKKMKNTYPNVRLKG